MTVLPGFAPAYSARASAANHRESISACRHDDLGVANANVTSKRRITPARRITVSRGGRLRRAQITAPAGSQLVQTESTGLFVVFSQGKPHLAIFIGPRNCESALTRVRSVRPLD
jgi:hypothetical protein